MKLLYITNAINGSGGLERVLSIKASYLADNLNYEVAILGLNNGCTNLFYKFSPKLELVEVEVTGSPISYIRMYISGIKNAVKNYNPDIIIVCDDGLKGFFIPTILGKSRPIIYERHVSKNIELRENASLIQNLFAKSKVRLMELLGSTFNKFIVLTKENTREWNLPNLEIISNPLSFYPEKSSSLKNKKVIAVGKQSYQKGYDRLLLAWQQVSIANPDWILEIYGKLDASQNLEDLKFKLGIDTSVHFFEPVKEIQDKYLESSIYVMSSRYEGFGMVLIEAMSCGVPCISFDCPYGPSDIIEDGADGFLVKNGEIDELASKISLLISDEDTRFKYGANAKENVKRFLPRPIMLQWDKLFKEIAN